MKNFDTVFFVRKLNDPMSNSVQDIERNLMISMVPAGVAPVSTYDHVTARTLIVAIGGDGTMLEAMRLSAASGAICTGFHAGKVGFLNDFPLPHPFETVEQSARQLVKLMEHDDIDRHIEYRTTLAVTRFNEGLVNQVKLACNEIAVAPIFSDQLLKYELFIDNKTAGVHKANSIIVSTATGSTAYSLSAGGSLILPESNVIQIVPVAPSTLTSRPIIVPASTKIRLQLFGLSASIRCDGMKAPFSDHTTDSVDIVQQQPARILHHPSWNFFNTLSNKLGWIKHCD